MAAESPVLKRIGSYTRAIKALMLTSGPAFQRTHFHRLNEQQQVAPEKVALLGAYVIRWLRWTQAAGLHGINPIASRVTLPKLPVGRAQSRNRIVTQAPGRVSSADAHT